MKPVLFTIGYLVVLFGREQREGVGVRSIYTMRLVAGLDTEAANIIGDSVELLTTPLHPGGKSNIVFLIPTTIIGLYDTVLEFALRKQRSY